MMDSPQMVAPKLRIRLPLTASRWAIRGVWTFAILGLIWLSAGLIAPPLIKAQVEKFGSWALGRSLTVESIDFRPWSLELTVHNLRVASADPALSQPQFKVDRIHLDLEVRSLLHLAPVLDSLAIDRPQLRIKYLGSGRYDIDDILARLRQLNAPPTEELARFALYNLVLQGGEVDFTDTSAGEPIQHTVRKLLVAIPFLSTLPMQRDVNVHPRLALELNGSSWDSAANATPFADPRKGEVQLQLRQLDVKPYLPYLPAAWPVQLSKGMLDADLRVRFEQSPSPTFQLMGTMALQDLVVADAGGKTLISTNALRVQIGRIEPLLRRIDLASVELDDPNLELTRLAGGNFNLSALASGTMANQTQADTTLRAEPPVTAWQLSLAQLKIKNGGLRWTDFSTQPMTQIQLAQLALQIDQLKWPLLQPADPEVRLHGSLQLVGNGPARVSFEGQARYQDAQVRLAINQLSLALFGPYLAPYLVPQPAGVIDAGVALSWNDAGLQASLEQFRARDIALLQAPDQPANEKTGQLLVKSLDVDNAQLDLDKRIFRVGKLRLTRPSLELERNAEGQWMFQRWLRSAYKESLGSPEAVTSKPWDLAIAEVLVDSGALSLRDHSTNPSVQLELNALHMQAQNISSAGQNPVAIRLAVRLGNGERASGLLQFNGSAVPSPLAVKGRLLLQDIPAHALVPYIADRLNVEVARADANLDGGVSYHDSANGRVLQLDADMAFTNLRINSLGDEGSLEELLTCKRLNLPGVALRLEPQSPLQLRVREVGLDDVYARIIISPQGRLNLQDIFTTDATDKQPASPPIAPDPVIDIGSVTLTQGRVMFSDRFIRPNYSINLSQLNGQISQLSSRPINGVVEPADIEMQGRETGIGSLLVRGKVNPFAKPLGLDIQGMLRDLELPPLSPYAIKYAGYGIKRGKMSADVSYKISPDGSLKATNTITLNQLQFGDKVENTSGGFPLKLAAALLADRNGVIDINLPVSGSLNDPEFKISSVMWKVISNLFVKAVTAPFNLLTHAFSSASDPDEISVVTFSPGRSQLGLEAMARLDKLSQALLQRPGLDLTVVGHADPAQERDSLRRERLNSLLIDEKRRIAGDNARVEVLSLAPAEYPALLRQTYRRAVFRKPRNLIGMTKDLSDAEMEKLLMENISISDETLRELAMARGAAIKEHLVRRQVPVERVFLGAVKTSGFNLDWSPRAELSLHMR
jgi:uncharacterized protein involved in outer membrane biogenesis